MVMAHMSHAYPDGCSIYFTFAGSAASDDEALATYDRAWSDALGAAIAAGGSLSHHHGVGRSKAPRMGAELNAGIELIGAIKGALDPAGVLNPGNLMPERTPLRQALPPAPDAPRIDPISQTVHVAGSMRIGDVDAALALHDLSLGVSAACDRELTVAAWLESGAPGAPDAWDDPVDHLVAGYDVELPCRAGLHIRPCPRRAVGPDLWSLFHGTGGRVGRIASVHLRARGAAATALDTPIAREPAVNREEADFIERALKAASELR
jgi:alkyldihydroxyacetonephosphate synthase